MRRTRRPEKSRKESQRGSSLVEAALVTLPFMAMMMGIVNLGLNFFLVDALQDRASLAARHASLNPSDVAGTKNVLLYGSPVALQEGDVIAPPPAYMGLDASNVSMQRLDVGLPTERILVTISGYKLPLFIPLMPSEVIGGPITATVPAEVP